MATTPRNVYKFKFAIDRGGTFTDIFAILPDNSVLAYKLLSENLSAYPDAPFHGIRKIIDLYSPTGYLNEAKIEIEWIRMGTTVATNALLERKGAKMALIVTKGFKDVLYIGNQARPNLFELDIKPPDILYDKVIEADERLIMEQPKHCALPPTFFPANPRHFQTQSGEKFIVHQELDAVRLRDEIKKLKDDHFTSIAVTLLHSYSCSNHEVQVEKVVREVATEQQIHVSLSSKVMPMVNIVPRGQTTCVDAYLTPTLKSYVSQFVDNIKCLAKKNHTKPPLNENNEIPLINGVNHLEDRINETIIQFMQSDGGLVDKDSFNGSRAILSGPAGGVIGYSVTTFNNKEETGENDMPVIGFDMGGTSTDVSRFDGQYEHVYDAVVAGITLQCPQLDIQTVAAGGGSRLFFRKGLFVVGPDSAGSNPGPKCYRKNGPLCITDANLCLGRILPHYFPKLFGPHNDQPLDSDATFTAFDEITQQINVEYSMQEYGKNNHLTREQVALGFITVANETMCRAIRNITQAKGYESSKHILACFGSAAGQHACAIADILDIHKIFIHKYSGILSAYGMALADVVTEEQEALNVPFTPQNSNLVRTRFKALETLALDRLIQQNSFANPNEKENIQIIRYLQMTYDGTFCPIMCSDAEIPRYLNSVETKTDILHNLNLFRDLFLFKYKREFGFTLPPQHSIVIENIRVRCILKSSVLGSFTAESKQKNLPAIAQGQPASELVTKCFFQTDLKDPKSGKFVDTQVYLDDHLEAGHQLVGPVIVISKNGTIVVEPGWICNVTPKHNILLTRSQYCNDSGKNKSSTNQELTLEKHHPNILDIGKGESIDPIKLSLFCHRFMSIAERMGRMLKLTALSTNIKERLDFSCAIFAPDGGLIANAPHIPVHLGSMQQAVKFQIETMGPNIHPGDVILTNHPCAGGSHLPDLTVIKPYFAESTNDLGSNERALFWVASRGHHADIGGILPGSMPANSTSLSQEGATFVSFKIVENGVFKEKELIEEFRKPEDTPGCSGARRIRDNIADLKAQIAACQKGIQLVKDLIREYGLIEVLKYMNFIRTNAAQTVSGMFKSFQDYPLVEIDENTDRKDLPYDYLVKLPNGFGSEIKSPKKLPKKVVRLIAEDRMDDGTPIKLKVDIDPFQGRATFDFTGTGYQVVGNCNTPKAITLSAILYCLRCMVGHDIPMNQGCLDPVEIIIPTESILDPSEDAAVVGGNVQTSQRIVDVIFKAFKKCAASQGCMNNVTFGDGSDIVYYETIAGGSGAGPGFHGRSGVHTHMTNTRITDPETLERRFPIVLKSFGLRQGSGGIGLFTGGDGIVREMIFRKVLNLSILTERRVFEPYGLCGGENGKSGINLLRRAKDGRIVYLGSKSSLKVDPGDTFMIMTPGGGGYGTIKEK